MSENPDPGAPPRAPAQSSGSSLLDVIAVGGAILIVGGVMVGLFLVTVPDGQLPVIASLGGLVAGTILGGYAGYRWGASEAMKKLSSGAGQ